MVGRSLAGAMLTVALWGGLWSVCSVAPAMTIDIRAASGYPSLAETTGGRGMTATNRPVAGVYTVVGTPVTISEQVDITEVSGVGATTAAPSMGDFSFRFNVFSGPDIAAALDAFANSPNVGNEVHLTGLSLKQTETALGTMNVNGVPNYYVEIDFPQFTLAPGDYVFSVTVDRESLAPWYWTESSADLGSDYLAASSIPGTIFNYKSQFGYSTGTSAVDVRGVAVPEPAAVVLTVPLLAFLMLAALWRLRRA